MYRYVPVYGYQISRILDKITMRCILLQSYYLLIRVSAWVWGGYGYFFPGARRWLWLQRTYRTESSSNLFGTV